MVKKSITIEAHSLTLYLGEHTQPTNVHGVLVAMEYLGEKAAEDKLHLAFCPEEVYRPEPKKIVLAGAQCLVHLREVYSVYGVKHDALCGVICNTGKIPVAWTSLFGKIKTATRQEVLGAKVLPCSKETLVSLGSDLSDIVLEHILNVGTDKDPLRTRPEGVYFSF